MVFGHGAESHSLLAPTRLTRDRSQSVASILLRGQSHTQLAQPPGSFNADLKAPPSRPDTSRADLTSIDTPYDDGDTAISQQRQADFRDRIDKETKIKVGSENLLEALSAKHPKQAKEQRKFVEAELNASNRKIAQLRLHLEFEIKRQQDQQSPVQRIPQSTKPETARSQSLADLQDNHASPRSPDAETESPTFLLAEILQALEILDKSSDYYVTLANDLVALLKRHPTLKYDLVWSNFGLRMQMMLLSDKKEIVAAGYRVLRHAITDRKSLQTVRSHQTDYLVIVSLVKDSKAGIEREQALRFVRAFLEVKDGVQEISLPVVRILVAIAEQTDDRLRPLCIVTLAEMLIRDPQFVISAGGVKTLTDALGNGHYDAPETLLPCFLHLLDMPGRRRLLQSGFEMSVPFAAFTDTSSLTESTTQLRSSARVITALFRSWSGLMTLSLHDFMSIQALIGSLAIKTPHIRSAVLDVLFDILHIRPPSWSSSFLAGRRLTTYGRVTNLRSDNITTTITPVEDDLQKFSLVNHFIAALLALLLQGGLVPALLRAERDSPDLQLKRKTTLLVGEVLKLSNNLLPLSWSSHLQVLPELFQSAAAFGVDERFISLGTIYHIDSVNRTLWRSQAAAKTTKVQVDDTTLAARAEPSKVQMSVNMDEAQFRNLMLESQVLNTVNYAKWRWDLIQPMIEGPLLNPKRLDEAMRATKFVHRLLGFLRPFKYRFSDAKNTKPNQRYIKTGCSLIRTLLQTTEGARYLAENKLVRQIAECLAQFDRMSGITSATPLFSVERLADTLVGGYFAILGVLCSNPKGLQMMERWRIINMFYHIVELQDRDDLIQALLTNLDYTIDSHPRIILAKAITSGSKQVRIAATSILREYALLSMDSLSGPASSAECARWAIRLLTTQLYDPEVEVCELAIKLLEGACSDDRSLEYIVKCRPALDHLGEIGAPLLLRFLSTSVGYHYLDGLDYITKEMDDWFLGRNDTYVNLVEASLARALHELPDRSAPDDTQSKSDAGTVPPHFYRELTRTAEGCELLRAKGHFEEFAAVMIDQGMEHDDPETILKIKGCLWAIGNIGSMELGSPFLEGSCVTSKIVEIAQSSQVVTLRGTAFFVLGLISRSVHGQEILAEHGWDGTVNMRGESLGYCLPLDFGRLFSMELHGEGEPQHETKRKQIRPDMHEDDATSRDILLAVESMGEMFSATKKAVELNGCVTLHGLMK